MLIEVLIFFLFRGSERIFRHLQTALHGILNISVQNLMKMHDFFLQTCQWLPGLAIRSFLIFLRLVWIVIYHELKPVLSADVNATSAVVLQGASLKMRREAPADLNASVSSK